jgi:hypothetical protein
VIHNHGTGDVVALIDGKTKETIVKHITENFTKAEIIKLKTLNVECIAIVTLITLN